MRRVLNQAANAAARAKGSIFEIVYRRTVPRLGHKQSIGIRESVTKNGAQRSPNNPSKSAPRE